MSQRRKRIKHKATERLAEEAIELKEAAEKQPPGSTLLLPRMRARVVLGMGEADCDFASNLYRHYVFRFRDS